MVPISRIGGYAWFAPVKDGPDNGQTKAVFGRIQGAIEALQEALARFGRLEIFNTDQGSQFTSLDFTDVSNAADVRISRDGRGRWMDNVFIERLWRSLK